jgi:hypothetical protein
MPASPETPQAEVHGCGFWCDFCETWVPVEWLALTGCARCFTTMHSSNFPERQMR